MERGAGENHSAVIAGLQSINLVETGANSKIGAALRSPKESAAPISKSPHAPKGRGRLYNELSPLDGRKVGAVANSLQLLRLGHRPHGSPPRAKNSVTNASHN